MASGLKSAEECRAMALLCRQQAACDPDKSWQLLGEAERWEYLAEERSAATIKDCDFLQSGRRDTRLAQHNGIGGHGDDGTSLKAPSL